VNGELRSSSGGAIDAVGPRDEPEQRAPFDRDRCGGPLRPKYRIAVDQSPLGGACRVVWRAGRSIPSSNFAASIGRRDVPAPRFRRQSQLQLKEW